MSQFDDTEDKITRLPFGDAVANSIGLDEYSEADVFGTEYAAPAGAPVETPNKIDFDRWGRYIGLPAIPGEKKPRAWTRATKLKDILPDKKNLELWQQRQVLRGLAMRPDLMRQLQDEIEADEIDFDSKMIKTWLNKICEDAKRVAGSFEGAEKGTAFHEAAELYDAGNPFKIDDLMGSLDPNQAEMLGAYAKLLADHKIKPIGDLMERVVCVPEINVVGRLDRVYEDQDGLFKIGDLKSQKWEPGAFDGIALTVQLAIYANATWMLDEDRWEWVPTPDMIDKSAGIIAWVPATKPGVAEIYELDLEWGWELAKTSSVIRNDWRKDRSRVRLRRRPDVPLSDLR